MLYEVITNFALELNPVTRRTVAAGVLWVATIFTGTLGLNRSLAIEKDRGSLDGLLLAPMDRSALYFGKALGNLLFILMVEVVIVITSYSIHYTKLYDDDEDHQLLPAPFFRRSKC